MTLDPTAFDDLYAAQADRLYRSALGIVRDPDAAADVVQEAFVRVYTADDEIISPAAWLATVARRLALNELRRRSRLTGLVEDATDDEEPSGTTLVESAVWTDPAKSAASADSVAGVAACLGGLRPDDRTLLTFRYGEGLEIGAIADLLGRTINATTVALHRARARFDAVYADRVFGRAGVPESCRPWRADAVAHADGKPASADYLGHLATCAPCQETDADLRSRSKAFAFAPLFGLPVVVPATLKATVVAGLAGHGVVIGAAGAAGAAAAGTAGATTATVTTTAGTVAGAAGGTLGAGGAAVATGITAKVAILAIVGVIGVAGLVATMGPMLLAKPSSSTFTTPSPTPAAHGPAISSVSAIVPRRDQTITIDVTGFGLRAPYVGDTEYIELADVSMGWAAGWHEPGQPSLDTITLNVLTWTDSRIVIGGLAGAYGSIFDSDGTHHNFNLVAGDQIRVRVWNAQTSEGPAIY